MRGVSGKLEDENWRLCSATLVRGVSAELSHVSIKSFCMAAPYIFGGGFARNAFQR